MIVTLILKVNSLDIDLAGQQQSRQNRMTFTKRIQPVQTRQCIAASAEAGFIEPEASKDSQLLTLDYSFTFELVLWCFSDVSSYMCCQKKASFEGEVRGAEAAEHPPASVSAGFGLADSRRGRLCCSNFIPH